MFVRRQEECVNTHTKCCLNKCYSCLLSLFFESNFEDDKDKEEPQRAPTGATGPAGLNGGAGEGLALPAEA